MSNKNDKGRRYEAEFKEGAVKLVNEKGRTVTSVAADLGIPENTLHRWLKENRDAQNGDHNRLKELEAENRRLRKELEDSKDTVEILKKAAAIFIKP